MKSENRKSSASGRAAKHGAAIATETTVADAEYASQLLAAAEALDAGAAPATEAVNGVSGSADTTSAVVVLPAQCVIRDAADLRKQLLQRIDVVEAVQIDATQLERIDAAAMQVLLAFVIDRSKQQHHVEWCGVSSVLNEAASALGLNRMLKLPAVEQAA